MSKRRARRVWWLGAGALAAAASMAACTGRERAAPLPAPAAGRLDEPAVIEIDLSRGLPESASASLFGPPSGRTHAQLVRSLRELAEAESAKGFLVRLGSARLAFARAHEIGRILGDVRKAGRPIVCHADEYNNATMLLAAAACSKLWLSPAGQVDTVGIAAQLMFAKGLLDRLNVDVDFLQVGKFKGASEPFTREGASPEARQSLQSALGGLREAWLSGIVEGRGKQELREAVEDGPFAPEEAKARGLVDELGDVEAAIEDAKKLAGTELSVPRFGGAPRDPSLSRSLVDVFRSISGASTLGTPHVAVVPAIGGITMTASGMPLGSSDGIGERELGRIITRLTKDTSAKAVVLRIDSPGGSALASDLLWQKLMRLREEKPLVVSIGGMAASGGYYLACAGTKILAEPTSIIGSIGVVGGKFAVGKALADIGINAETVAANPDPTRAARAAYMSALTPWDEPTRARVLASMEAVYDLFLKRITAGRNLPLETIAPSAEGRIFGGVEAQERSLVDELGGLERAIALARELAELPEDAPVEIEQDDGGLLELLAAGDETGEDAARAPDRAALKERAREAMAGALLPEWLGVAPEIGTFAASMAPLLAGERALTVLPFAVTLR
ncbi:Signal peptide peptidase [Sorangium cellulosum]|uniref:Signal peptide peptidase n=1 Tax=Sorangium cellulosum TaxID=56 RepID=A0A150TVV2_SORCE|nr:Signal peptide peptidase [Sorangium cellulosum]